MIYCTGADGFLGRHFIKEGCKPLRVDVLDYNAVDRAIAIAKPSFVLHLAGESDPDKCENDYQKTSRVNVTGTDIVMRACHANSVPAVLLSSAQIWGGGWWESLWNRHSENSRPTIPANTYGLQKTVAEWVTLSINNGSSHDMKVIRTSFVFNRERFHSQLSDLKHGVSIDAPTFLKRSFIHAVDFTSLVKEYMRQFYQMPHVLHLAGSETVSYYDFWKEVCRQFGYDSALVKPRRVEKTHIDGQKKARRPHNSGLDVRLSFKYGFRAYGYREGIERMKNES